MTRRQCSGICGGGGGGFNERQAVLKYQRRFVRENNDYARLVITAPKFLLLREERSVYCIGIK